MKSSGENLEASLTSDGKSNINVNELYVELKLLQDFIPKENMGSVEILKFLERHDFFSRCNYRVQSYVDHSFVSPERSLSKLKLLKSYLRSTMTYEILNDLAMTTLESDIQETIKYEPIIEDFYFKEHEKK